MSVHEAVDELDVGRSGCCCCALSSVAMARARAAPRVAAVALECNTKSEVAELLAGLDVGNSQHGSMRCPDGA